MAFFSKLEGLITYSIEAGLLLYFFWNGSLPLFSGLFASTLFCYTVKDII